MNMRQHLSCCAICATIERHRPSLCYLLARLFALYSFILNHSERLYVLEKQSLLIVFLSDDLSGAISTAMLQRRFCNDASYRTLPSDEESARLTS